MDIEKVMKINEMSKELKKHGLDPDYERDKITKEINPDQDAEERKAEDNKVSEQNSEKEENQSQPENVRQIEQFIESELKQVVEFVKDAKKINDEKIDALEEEIISLKRKIQDFENQITEKPTKALPQEKESVNTADDKSKKETSNESSPSNGDYGSNDVSVENIFYYGQK